MWAGRQGSSIVIGHPSLSRTDPAQVSNAALSPTTKTLAAWLPNPTPVGSLSRRLNV